MFFIMAQPSFKIKMPALYPDPGEDANGYTITKILIGPESKKAPCFRRGLVGEVTARL
jgi:hypothetical protein